MKVVVRWGRGGGLKGWRGRGSREEEEEERGGVFVLEVRGCEMGGFG